MNASQNLVRMEPFAETVLMATSASVCLDFRAITVIWTSMNVLPVPVRTTAHAWMKWITTGVNVPQASQVKHSCSPVVYCLEMKINVQERPRIIAIWAVYTVIVISICVLLMGETS